MGYWCLGLGRENSFAESIVRMFMKTKLQCFDGSLSWPEGGFGESRVGESNGKQCFDGSLWRE